MVVSNGAFLKQRKALFVLAKGPCIYIFTVYMHGVILLGGDDFGVIVIFI